MVSFKGLRSSQIHLSELNYSTLNKRKRIPLGIAIKKALIRVLFY